MINICRTPIQEMHLTRTLPAWFKRFFFAIALLAEARGQKRWRKKKCCGAERSIFTVSGTWSSEIGRVSVVRPSVVEEKQSNQPAKPKRGSQRVGGQAERERHKRLQAEPAPTEPAPTEQGGRRHDAGVRPQRLRSGQGRSGQGRSSSGLGRAVAERAFRYVR